MLSFDLISHIMSFIIAPTPTGIIVFEHMDAKRQGFICCNCSKVIIHSKISLTCQYNHLNCWDCLVAGMRIDNFNCKTCDYTFQCLYDEKQHI